MAAVTRALLALFAVALTAQACAAAARRVPVDFATIQAAVDASSAGDTVLIDPGSYSERLVLRSGVTVRAASIPGSVTIDAAGQGACAVISFGGLNTRIQGLRMIGGTGDGTGGNAVGGALHVVGGSFEAIDCAFENGFAAFGGGTAAQSANVTFTRCRWLNTAAPFGGGHFQAGGTAHLVDAILEDVSADDGGAVYATLGAQLFLHGARMKRAIAQRNGGGLYVESAVAAVSETWFDGTSAAQKGGGIAVAAGGQVLASFCVFVDNASGQGGGAFHVSCAPSAARLPGGERATVSPRVDCALLDLTHVDVLGAQGAAPAAGAVTDAGAIRMRHSMVAGNASGLACLDSRATLDVTCSALYGNGGPDLSGSCAPGNDPSNRSEDPHVCDRIGRDFRLCSNSALLDPGCGEPFWGAYGEGCAACGPTPALEASWGRLKALYHR